MYYRASPLHGLGALQRQNPLPPGHYWIDVFGETRAKMAAWAKTNQAAVQIESTTDDNGQTWYVSQAITDWLDLWSSSEDPTTGSTRYTFRTTASVPWDAVTFGYPEIIVDPPPGTPAPTPSKPNTPAKPAQSPVTSTPSTGMSSTVIAVAAGVVLIGAVAFAVLHRKKAA